MHPNQLATLARKAQWMIMNENLTPKAKASDNLFRYTQLAAHTDFARENGFPAHSSGYTNFAYNVIGKINDQINW